MTEKYIKEAKYNNKTIFFEAIVEDGKVSNVTLRSPLGTHIPTVSGRLFDYMTAEGQSVEYLVNQLGFKKSE